MMSFPLKHAHRLCMSFFISGYQMQQMQQQTSIQQQQMASQQQKRLSATDFCNYNTAPRGFSTGQPVYHPVMFYNIS